METAARARTFKFFSGAPLAWVGLSRIYILRACVSISTCTVLFTAAGLLSAHMILTVPAAASQTNSFWLLNLSLSYFKWPLLCSLLKSSHWKSKQARCLIWNLPHGMKLIGTRKRHVGMHSQHLLRLFVMHKATINESHVKISSLCNQESVLLKLHMYS